MPYTRCLSFPVALGFVLVTFVYYTVIVLVVRPWLGIFTANGLFNAISFTTWYLMVLWCYSMSIFMDPGSVPPRYSPETEEGAGLQEVKRKGGELRFCQKCLCYKPPRAHHCRVCKRCVLRMDHHCIWINNCVGHRNYKAFVLFVLFDVIALMHGLTLVLSHTALCMGSHSSLSPAQCLQKVVSSDNLQPDYTWMHPSPSATIFFKVVFVIICLPLGISLLVLLLWHFFLMAHNKTTIEASTRKHKHACRKCKSDEEEEPLTAETQGTHSHSHDHKHEKSKEWRGLAQCLHFSVSTLSRRSLIAMFLSHSEGVRARCLNPKALEVFRTHPYDLGVAENLHAILGPNPLFWLCPSANGYLHTGLRFPTAYDAAISEIDRDL